MLQVKFKFRLKFFNLGWFSSREWSGVQETTEIENQSTGSLKEIEAEFNFLPVTVTCDQIDEGFFSFFH